MSFIWRLLQITVTIIRQVTCMPKAHFHYIRPYLQFEKFQMLDTCTLFPTVSTQYNCSMQIWVLKCFYFSCNCIKKFSWQPWWMNYWQLQKWPTYESKNRSHNECIWTNKRKNKRKNELCKWPTSERDFGIVCKSVPWSKYESDRIVLYHSASIKR